MPTDLPPEPALSSFWLGVLRVVRGIAWLRDETIARTLLLRFSIFHALNVVAIGLGYVALFLSQRRWRVGIWLFELTSALMRVAIWVRPDCDGPFLRRASRPEA
jgi:hypothetical protein